MHPGVAQDDMQKEGRHFAVCLFVHTNIHKKAGPFSVARLKMDLPFHNRLACNRKSANPLVQVFLRGIGHDGDGTLAKPDGPLAGTGR